MLSFFSVPLQISVAPSSLLVLRRQDTNTTADCYGYGKPSPIVTWFRYGVQVPLVNDAKISNNSERVFQILTSGGNASSQWNASSRLYIAPRGVTYLEAGTYVCQVQNSVQRNITVNESVDVACKYWPVCSVRVAKTAVAAFLGIQMLSLVPWALVVLSKLPFPL